MDLAIVSLRREAVARSSLLPMTRLGTKYYRSIIEQLLDFSANAQILSRRVQVISQQLTLTTPLTGYLACDAV